MSNYLGTKGYQCTITNNAEDGLALMEHQAFDAIMLDLQLPEFNSPAFVDYLQKSGIFSKSKTILFTAPCAKETKTSFLKKGAYACLQKPIRLETLVQYLEDLDKSRLEPSLSKNEIVAKLDELGREIKTLEDQRKNAFDSFTKLKITIFASMAACVLLGIFLMESYISSPPTNDELSSEYLIQDTLGGKITTWIAWKIVSGQLFHIHVEQSPEVTDHRMQIIRNVIFSNETVSSGNSVYYKGWEGAMMAASRNNTIYPIPVHFHTMITDTGTGNIVISLTNMQNPDGFTGLTKTIADPTNHEVLKSNITIYGVGQLTDDQFAIILRHELGHAFGLAYSSDSNDIMHLTINQEQPYISTCDVNAITSLYNGNGQNVVTCKDISASS